MKKLKVVLLVLWVVIILVSIVIGSYIYWPSILFKSVEKHNDGLIYINIRTDKDVYKLGETVKINGSLINDDEISYNLSFENITPSIVIIKNKNGKEVYRSLTTRLSRVIYINISAKSQLQLINFEWHQIIYIYHGGVIEPGSGEYLKEKGEYIISVKLKVYDIWGSKTIFIK